MGIWARLAEMVAAPLALPADSLESPEARNAREIGEWEEALAQARRYACVAAACKRRLARELQRQGERVAGWERRARQAEADGRQDLAGLLGDLKRQHEELHADLQTHHAAAERDFRAAAGTVRTVALRLTEARLIACVFEGRRAKRDV